MKLRFTPPYTPLNRESAIDVLTYTKQRLNGEYVSDDLINRVRDIMNALGKAGVWVTLEKITMSYGTSRREYITSLGSPWPIITPFYTLNLIIDTLRAKVAKPVIERSDVIVTVNDEPRELTDASTFMPGYHGLLLKKRDGSLRAVLPEYVVQVLETDNVSNVHELLNKLCNEECESIKVFNTQSYLIMSVTNDVIQRALWLNKFVRRLFEEATSYPSQGS